ncbi:MAG: hypothetical protein A2496_01000 [Burkholderiales bacterium RIFOXYC12_FULL_60_6]|nr:MAG: hypothetical protein A2496_01000 [Burkholderiales bacterium RIFOXYC12_FULL_60_6]
MARQRGAEPVEADDGSIQTPFEIRPFEPRDSEEVIALLATIAANRQFTDDQWRDVRIRLRELPMVEVFVAQTCQAPALIIGCVALSVVRGLTEGRGFINDMAVLPSYRRQGVGAKLLEAVMRRAGQLNLSSLMVNTHRANDQARAFYAACGFSLEEILRLKIR